MTSARGGLDLLLGASPLVAAPMAGGAGTPALVAAAVSAGHAGFLAGGYRSAADLAAQIAEVRAEATRFGVNLFAPHPVPISAVDFDAYRRELAADATALGVSVPPGGPVVDDDAWDAKLDLLLSHPVPAVSFTFGLPDSAVFRALQDVGTLTLQTVTTPDEAVAATGAGADALIVQSAAAGGHAGTWHPEFPPDPRPLAELVATVRAVTPLPVIAAGGVGSPEDVAAALAAGATAVAVGTALLRADEAGTSATHRQALGDPRFRETVRTRAFTGRPARALRSAFTDAHADAPLGYPALHHLTSPLRRAAAAAGDADRLHLWAGTGWQQATAGSTADILARLTPR